VGRRGSRRERGGGGATGDTPHTPTSDVGRFFQLLEVHLQRRKLAQFKAQELAMLLWSFASAAAEDVWLAPLVFELCQQELGVRSEENMFSSNSKGKKEGSDGQVLPKVTELSSVTSSYVVPHHHT